MHASTPRCYARYERDRQNPATAEHHQRGSMSKHAPLVALMLFALQPITASAQQSAAKDYPSKPIRVVVPYAPGGPMDFIARTLGNKMAPTLGQNFVIDNRQ